MKNAAAAQTETSFAADHASKFARQYWAHRNAGWTHLQAQSYATEIYNPTKNGMLYVLALAEIDRIAPKPAAEIDRIAPKPAQGFWDRIFHKTS